MSRSSNEALCLTLRLGIDTTSFLSSDTGRCRALSDQSVCPILYLISLRGTCQSRQHCLIGSPLYPEMGADLRGSVASRITSWRGRALKGISSPWVGNPPEKAQLATARFVWLRNGAGAHLRLGLIACGADSRRQWSRHLLRPLRRLHQPPACASAKVLVRAKAVAKAIAVSFMFMFLVV